MLSNASRLSRGVIARSGLEFISGFRDTSFSILIYFQSFIVQSSKTPKLYIGNGRATTSSAVMKLIVWNSPKSSPNILTQYSPTYPPVNSSVQSHISRHFQSNPSPQSSPSNYKSTEDIMLKIRLIITECTEK